MCERRGKGASYLEELKSVWMGGKARRANTGRPWTLIWLRRKVRTQWKLGHRYRLRGFRAQEGGAWKDWSVCWVDKIFWDGRISNWEDRVWKDFQLKSPRIKIVITSESDNEPGAKTLEEWGPATWVSWWLKLDRLVGRIIDDGKFKASGFQECGKEEQAGSSDQKQGVQSSQLQVSWSEGRGKTPAPTWERYRGSQSLREEPDFS